MAIFVRSLLGQRGSKENPGGCTYDLIENDTVVFCQAYGYITKAVFQNLLDQSVIYGDRLRQQGKPVLFLADLSRVTGVSAEARGMLGEPSQYSTDKSAVYGANTFITLITQYAVRNDARGRGTRVFRSRRQAMDWLQGKRNFPRLLVARAIGSMIASLGIFAITGWLTGIDVLYSLSVFSDPISPLVAIGFLVIGVSLVLLTFRKTMARKVAVRTGAVWLGIPVITIIARSWFGINIPLDTLFFSVLSTKEIPPYPAIVAIIFVLVGALMWLTTLPLVRKTSSQIFRGVMVISILSTIVLLVADALSLVESHIMSTLIIVLGADMALVAITHRKPGRFPIARRILLRYGQGIGIFVVFAIVTLVIWQRTLQTEETDALDRTSDAVTAKINLNIDVLRGYRALFRSADVVKASDFDSYYTELGISENNPGIDSIVFLKKVATPQGDTYPITYVSPAGNSANLGSNFGSDVETSQLLEIARDTGKIILSDTFRGLPLVNGTSRHELLVITAIYGSGTANSMSLAGRRDDLYGFVVAEFDYDAFFRHFVHDFGADSNIPLVVKDVHNQRILYRTPVAFGNENEPVASRTITVADHSWSIEILKRNIGDGGPFFMPNTILLSGVLLGLLTSSLVVVLVRRRREVLDLAEAITDDLEVERDKAMQTTQKNNAIISDIGDGIIITDAKGRIVMVNDRFTELMGWKLSDVKGQYLYEILPVTDARGRLVPRSRRPIVRVLRDNAKITISLLDELFYKRKDGSSFAAAYTIAPIEVDGKVTGAVEVLRDVSAEAEIDRTKTEFISLASHQLRTPLTATKWYIELLRDGEAGELQPAQKIYADRIHIATLRTLDIVSYLLNLSRLEMHKMAVDPKLMDMVAFSRGLVKDASKEARSHNITILQDYSQTPMDVRADPDLLHVVIDNLLSNAVKYSPDGATVLFTVTRDRRGGTLITVQDNGYGIPANQQDEIFKKLFRADNIKKKSTVGAGLGLALVKAILDYTGGRIWFTSVEGKGSTFYVRIPSAGMAKKDI